MVHPDTLTNNHWSDTRKASDKSIRIIIFSGESSKKGGIFTVRLTVRGGWSAPSALTVSKCEHFGPIFPIIKW